jgi:hypothetical protein
MRARDCAQLEAMKVGWQAKFGANPVDLGHQQRLASRRVGVGA